MWELWGGARPLAGWGISKLYRGVMDDYKEKLFPSPYRGYHF